MECRLEFSFDGDILSAILEQNAIYSVFYEAVRVHGLPFHISCNNNDSMQIVDYQGDTQTQTENTGPCSMQEFNYIWKQYSVFHIISEK